MQLLSQKMRRSWTMTRFFGPGRFDDMMARAADTGTA